MATRAIPIGKVQTAMSDTETPVVETKELKVSKKIKHFDGTEIKREGVAKFLVPLTNQAALEMLGDNLVKWAVFGITSYVRTTATNSITGLKTKETKALLRDFKNAHKTFVEVMEMSPEDAYKNLLERKKFAELNEYFDNLKKSGEVTELDYTKELPTPRKFEDESAEEDEDNEDSEE